jgi:hypothetical protein
MSEVLKQMVEALECALSDDKPYIDKCKQAIQAGKKAIAELESQKPFAYVNVEMRRLEFAHNYVKWDTPTTIKLDKIPLYTHPPQRTWVGLTDEEQSFIYDQVKQIVDSKPFWVRFADAVEAKLREKNT